MDIRTRFTPSPTRYLHVGGFRTALYSWRFARRLGGRFAPRIEDTDLAHSTRTSAATIPEDVRWHGLECDEGLFCRTHRFERTPFGDTQGPILG